MRRRDLFPAIALSIFTAGSGCAAVDDEPLGEDEPTEAFRAAVATNSPESVSAGTSWDLDAYIAPAPFALPPGKAMVDIGGVAIADSEHCIFWLADGTATSGISTDLDYYDAPYAYTLPAGREPTDIVGMAVGTNGRVNAWYVDGTFSVGTSW